jgi:antagonist of KipI
MQIRIIKPGMLSTLQDGGRYGFLSQAVPISGCMDSLSARLANLALGNEDNAAVIEFTYANAEFITETDILIAYAGDGAILSLAIGDIPAERPVFIPAGTLVKLNNSSLGSRTYLSIAGGWDVPEVLGSRSTYLTAAIGGLHGRQLQAGDILNSISQLTPTSENILDSLKDDGPNYTNWSLARQLLLPADRKAIRVVSANEAGWFEDKSLTDFLATPYSLSLRSNRMGYQLEGAMINRIVNDELLSTAVTPGTIQVTGSGSLVLLMADCQTTGGYPRIAQVAAVDLPLCGQLKPGDSIYFKEISRQEAETMYIEREKQMLALAGTVKKKYCN